MSPKFLFHLGQSLKGGLGTYTITKQISEFIYFASNQKGNPVVIKSIEGHWRLHNERDILTRFQARTPALRPLLDEIKDPAEPPAIVLRYLDDDLVRASKKQRLTRPEIKQVARNVLEALRTLHEDGFVHTDIKPSNILVNYGNGENRFAEIQLADCGGTVGVDSEFAKKGRPWGTATDIWSFGVTLINFIWGLNFHIFEPKDMSEDNERYPEMIVTLQHQWFGPFRRSITEILDQDAEFAVIGIMANVKDGDMKPFVRLNEREICQADKAFVLKIMKLDPRDRPTAKDLLEDEWFTEREKRTVGWYSKEEWALLKAR